MTARKIPAPTKAQRALLFTQEAEQGERAFRAGKSVWANPHYTGSRAHALWCFGWRYACWEKTGAVSRQEAGLPPLRPFCCSSTSVGLGP
jgi:hypothetical protein